MEDKVVNFDVDLSKWNVEKPLDDVVWVLMLDEPDKDIIKKGGIFVPTASTVRSAFRIGKSLKVGPNVKHIKEGDFLLIPPQTGMLGFKSVNNFKTLFIKENAVMSIISFDGNKEEFLKHQAEDLFATL